MTLSFQAGNLQAAYQILKVSPDVDADTLHAAYIEQVKAFPPDRCPEQFQHIRDAYQQLKDPDLRAERLIIGPDPHMPLSELIDGGTDTRDYVGQDRWIEAMKLKPKL